MYAARDLEELPEAIGLLLVIGLENLLGPVEPLRPQKRFPEKGQECHVPFARRKRFEQRDGSLRVALAQLGFREEQRATPVLWRYLVGAPEIFERQVESSGGEGKLPGPQETARGQVGVAQLFGEFAQRGVPVGILGIEKRDALAAGQRFDIPPVLVKQIDRRPELLDGLRDAILLLQQRCVAHQSVGRLRKRAQKTQKNRGRLRGVSRLDQPVELRAVILRGHGRLVQASVDIRERLQRFRVRRHFFERGLILGNRLAQLILLQTSSRSLEVLVDVLGHGIRLALSATDSFAKTSASPQLQPKPTLYTGDFPALKSKSTEVSKW